ncbi:hypothetical protein STA3757_30620 [Stanieria sp. NIES-3757]|nr:hypothetical protein STA3757_30620 [Stanieria sp. NIES-3757]
MKCQESNCLNEAIEWFYYSEEEKAKTILCEEHAKEAGFCLGYGHFLGGTSELEESPGYQYGYCSECWEDLSYELEDCYYEDEDCHPY